MAQKYFLEYNDVSNIVHRLEISSTTYVGSTTEINGSVFMDYAQTNDTIESIRGKGLRVELEANLSLTFDDLYSEVDRTWSVVYKRDSVVLFNGWLDSDGLFEDYVSDRWIISLSCVDGLGYLKELSYVDSSGITFSGNQKLIDIIVNCLNRTGVIQNINTNIDIYYDGLSTSLDILNNVYFNANRYVKEDNETIMSCDEVLRSVLEAFSACITTFEGEWYIYKPNQIFLDNTPTFFRYDSDGVALAPPTKVLDISYDLGSQVDGFFPHHCSANQRLENNKSIGAYRISYKYGLVQSFFDNIDLAHNGVTIDEWTINSTTNLTLNGSGLGVDLAFTNTTSVKNLTSDSVAVTITDSINLVIKFKTIFLLKGTQPIFWGKFRYKVILTGASTYYFLTGTSSWTLVNVTNTLEGGDLDSLVEFVADLPLPPISGNITIEIWTPIQQTDETGTFYLQQAYLSPSVDDSSNRVVKGEFHTFQREDNPSSNIKDTKEVSNGDQPSDFYYGTVYKTDSATPTDIWNRKGFTDEIPLLKLMGDETMRLNAETMRVFSGSVFGYIPYLSVVSINNVTGKFMPIAYMYDTKANITNFTFKQIYGDELTDIAYEKTFDFGNTVKPTIKG